MPDHHLDLLDVARRLLRRGGRPGRLSGGCIRRSISTTYYAMFHFLLDEASKRLVGTHNDLKQRRRVLMRSFTHRGTRLTMAKVQGATVEASVAELLRPSGSAGAVVSPAFARTFARAFLDAQAKREDADYNLNQLLSEADARALQSRATTAIDGWKAARSAADKAFKDALYLLLALRGQMRRDDA